MTLGEQKLPLGTVIDHYETREVLGIGGFGVTYKAWDSILDRWVAIKEFLPSDLAVREQGGTTIHARTDRTDDYHFALDKFLQEAKTLAKFDHPNIVRVTRFLEANGTGYLVMDFVEGQSLSDYLKRNGGTVPEAQLKAWFVPILRGLVEVHKIGFLHRDIKPGNIYLRDEGEPLLIDFGAARQAIGEHSRSVTGIVSAGYAPTEQYGTDAKKQGPWTDLYSVGATLYRCAVGKDPVDAPTRQSALVEGEPDPLTPAREAGVRNYNLAFLQLIDELLALPIKQRPQSAERVLAATQQKQTLAVEEPRSTEVTRVVHARNSATAREPLGAGSQASEVDTGVPPATESGEQLLASERSGGKSAGRRLKTAAVLIVLISLGIGLYLWGSRYYFKSQQLYVSAGEVFRDRLYSGGTGPELVGLPQSEFVMGDDYDVGEANEKPAHQVDLQLWISMMTHEVTFNEYDKFIDATGGARPDDEGWGRGNRPVINVNWRDAQSYANWLSEETGMHYRLPTEAEWEDAAVSSLIRIHNSGDSAAANCADCGSSWDNKQTAPVGSFGADHTGLHDMLGNVTEWVQDCYHETYEGAPEDGGAWETNCATSDMFGDEHVMRVLRGGSWQHPRTMLRAKRRGGTPEGVISPNLGFRLVRVNQR